jgi:hypothetical protein
MSVLVSRPAPDFTAAAVLGSGEIVDSFTLSEAAKTKEKKKKSNYKFHLILKLQFV